MSEVYDRYVDTAGNYHYADVETGHHVIPNTAVGNFPPPQTIQTNADRIRSMTDEELADLLSGGEPYPWCEQDPCPAETCQECIMMWLNQEAKHDL